MKKIILALITASAFAFILACDGGSSSGNGSSENEIAGWTCNPDFYASKDGCDCGCGIVDPDCPDSQAGSCEYTTYPGSCAEDPGDINPDNNAVCTTDPGTPVDPGTAAWTCGTYTYGTGNGCDCGCGIVDPDCADATHDSCENYTDGSCYANQEGRIDENNNAICNSDVISGWTCNLAFYNSGPTDGCDCGCGIVDPDCADASSASCLWFENPGSCAADGSLINPADNSTCTSESNDAPAEWTCNKNYYGSGGTCDCGCGVVDPDCENATSSVCVLYGMTGSCFDGTNDIDPENNAICTSSKSISSKNIKPNRLVKK